MKRWMGFVLLMFLAGGCTPKSKSPPTPTPPPATVDTLATTQAAVPTPEERLTPERQTVIACIPKTLNNPVFAYARAGALRAAAKIGKVTIQWAAPADHDPAGQAAVVDAMVEKGVDGILISCADSEMLRPSIDRAAEKGIPVVTFDSDSPASKRVCFYGVDDEIMGRQLGEDMARLLGNKGRVAILSGSQNALNLQKRRQGALEVLARHPEIAVINTYYCNDDAALSAKILAAVTARQKPDGWIFVGGWPLFTEHGLDFIPPGEIKIVAVDPLPEGWKWIEDNRVQVCLGQKVFGWGEEGVKLVLRAIAQQSLPPFVDSGFDVVTPENLPAYKEKWKTNKTQEKP